MALAQKLKFFLLSFPPSSGNFPFVETIRVCSFGANLLHLGNVGKQVSRRFLGLRLFGHFVSYLLGLSNAHTSMGATFAL